MTGPGPSRRQIGQAAIEVLGLVPAVLVLALGAWQLAAVSWAALQADEAVRRQALAATGGGTTTVRAEARVPVVLPGVGPLRVRARATVRMP